jgi:hypothetical protein
MRKRFDRIWVGVHRDKVMRALCHAIGLQLEDSASPSEALDKYLGGK